VSPTSGGALQRVRELERAVDHLEERAQQDAKKIALLEEQISGSRGLEKAVVALADEVAGVRRSGYWLAGIIIAASIGFAFGVLALVPA
jgi:hypothetical protein